MLLQLQLQLLLLLLLLLPLLLLPLLCCPHCFQGNTQNGYGGCKVKLLSASASAPPPLLLQSWPGPGTQ